MKYLLLAFLIVSCGAKTINKDEKKTDSIATTIAVVKTDSTSIDKKVLVYDVETDEIVIEAVDTTEPIEITNNEGKVTKYKNARISKKKRKPSKSRPRYGSSSQNSRSSKTSAGSFLRGVGISSPFEASRAAANQGRTLGVKNIVGLMKSVTTGTTMLRQWADKFRTAMSMGDEKLKQEVVDGFKKLSKELTKLSDSLSDDIVAQNAFRAIVQSFQDNMTITNPEVGKIFADYPLYESNTPDAKMASEVGTTIDKNSVSEK